MDNDAAVLASSHGMAVVMDLCMLKEHKKILSYFCNKLSITLGSASVEVSPKSSVSFCAIFFRILLIIYPDLVFGSPEQN